MRDISRTLVVLLITGIFMYIPMKAQAQNAETQALPAEGETQTLPAEAETSRSAVDAKKLQPYSNRFTWGADLGCSIDLGGNDMSTFDIDVVAGYKNAIFRFIGAGTGIHRSLGSGNHLIPIYALLRTSFRPQPSLFFFNLKAGYSFNTMAESKMKGGMNFSIGCGINLAMTKKLQSHIILSYGYFRMNAEQQLATNLTTTHIDQAQIRFGVNF